MLRPLMESEFEAAAEQAYTLSLDLSKTSYPIYTDGLKTKEDFLTRSRKGLMRDTEEILVYEKDGIAQGWIHYEVLPEDHYLGLCNMTMGKGYAEAFAELLAYWKSRYPGYTWGKYFPEENREIRDFLAANGYGFGERQSMYLLWFRDYTCKKDPLQVVRIDKENFSIFREIHRAYENNMYWTSDCIEPVLDDWAIFAYLEGDTCLGTVYYNGVTCQDKDFEIFGIDLLDGKQPPEVTHALLTAALNDAKRAGANSMYFSADDVEGEQLAAEVGFQHLNTAYFFEGRL